MSCLFPNSFLDFFTSDSEEDEEEVKRGKRPRSSSGAMESSRPGSSRMRSKLSIDNGINSRPMVPEKESLHFDLSQFDKGTFLQVNLTTFLQIAILEQQCHANFNTMAVFLNWFY